MLNVSGIDPGVFIQEIKLKWNWVVIGLPRALPKGLCPSTAWAFSGQPPALAPDPLPAGMCSDLENFWKTQVRLLLTVGGWDVGASASGLSWFFVAGV